MKTVPLMSDESFSSWVSIELKRVRLQVQIFHTSVCQLLIYIQILYLPGLLKGQGISLFLPQERGRFPHQPGLDRKENENSENASDESSWASGNSSVTVVPRRGGLWRYLVVVFSKGNYVKCMDGKILRQLVIMIGTACQEVNDNAASGSSS